MKKKLLVLGLLILSTIFILEGCKKDGDGIQPNIFSLQDDIDLGMQVRDEIKSNPQDYPLLDETQYANAYNHLYRIRDSIINTGEVDHSDLFDYEVFIIKNDTVLNAFATPGGYLYFYTGLIKYLDNEAEFAGVMGHEMGHSAERHTTEQLTVMYGYSMLISIVLGQNPNEIAQMAATIAGNLGSLAFSRKHENDSDEKSVNYLYKTTYNPKGVAGFFEKMEGALPVPVFMSTHPSPENRVAHIDEVWTEMGGKTGNEYIESYEQFKASLP